VDLDDIKVLPKPAAREVQIVNQGLALSGV